MRSSDFSWIKYGNCRDAPIDVFFPEKYTKETMLEARSFCADCPARINCLHYALSQGSSLEGVWCGTSPSQRRRIRSASNQGIQIVLDSPLSATRTWKRYQRRVIV